MQSLTSRKLQIFAQLVLLGLMMTLFGHVLAPLRILFISGACLMIQYFFDRTNKREFNFQSALITSLSLLLLLRTNSLLYDFAACLLAIGSKFIVRTHQQHIFNPANFAIVIFLFFGWGWVSPTQWGHETLIVLLLVLYGTVLCHRARRLDVPLTFLAVSWGLLFYRHIIFLGDPLPIFFHRISLTTLYVFAFLMISDPMTTPRHLSARILWVSMIALMSFVVESHYFIRNGTLYVLFFFAPLHFLLNKTIPGVQFTWEKKSLG